MLAAVMAPGSRMHRALRVVGASTVAMVAIRRGPQALAFLDKVHVILDGTTTGHPKGPHGNAIDRQAEKNGEGK
jgi:hypothetical protein